MASPVQLDVIGDCLAIRWDDNSESFIPLEKMRKHCPCAVCVGEPDVAGPMKSMPIKRELTADSFCLKQLEKVGAYGLQPIWCDGHSAGVYSYDLLRSLGE